MRSRVRGESHLNLFGLLAGNHGILSKLCVTVNGKWVLFCTYKEKRWLVLDTLLWKKNSGSTAMHVSACVSII